MQRAEGRPESCLHRAATQGERENQGYISVHQDLSRILKLSILSVVVSFLDTLIRKCVVFIGFGILVCSVVARCNVGYLYTRVCVWLL